jgi:hypothetical protein
MLETYAISRPSDYGRGLSLKRFGTGDVDARTRFNSRSRQDAGAEL